MSARREAFLAGERPDDVAIFIDDAVVEGDLSDAAERTDEGWLLVVDGESGRSVFQRLAGVDPMAFARQAGDNRTSVSRDLIDGECPVDTEHTPEYVFAFVEAQNEDVGGLYAEGPVVHAYAHCECGTDYSERWVAGD
ncbi:MAG: DUF5807 family protein [Halobacteriaceae archaeon]